MVARSWVQLLCPHHPGLQSGAHDRAFARRQRIPLRFVLASESSEADDPACMKFEVSCEALRIHQACYSFRTFALHRAVSFTILKWIVCLVMWWIAVSFSGLALGRHFSSVFWSRPSFVAVVFSIRPAMVGFVVR